MRAVAIVLIGVLMGMDRRLSSFCPADGAGAVLVRMRFGVGIVSILADARMCAVAIVGFIGVAMCMRRSSFCFDYGKPAYNRRFAAGTGQSICDKLLAV